MSFLEGFIGAGTVRLQRIVNGVYTGGLEEAGNIISLSPSATPDKKEIISRRKDTHGNALDTVLSATSFKITWQGNTFFRRVWDMLLLGATTLHSSEAIVDEPFTVPVLDEWVPFGNMESFPRHSLGTVTDETGVTTYVEGTDYEWREDDGAIRILSTGSIGLGDDILGDLTGPADGYRVDLNSETSKTIRMFVDGVNEFNDRLFSLELYQVSASPTAIPDMLSADVQTYTFEGTCEVPSWASAPGKLEYID